MKKKEERRRRRKGGEGKKFRASPRLAVGVKRYQLCYATLMNVPLETATRRGRERERERNGERRRGRERERESKRVARGLIALTTVCTRARSFTHAAPHESLVA